MVGVWYESVGRYLGDAFNLVWSGLIWFGLVWIGLACYLCACFLEKPIPIPDFDGYRHIA